MLSLGTYKEHKGLDIMPETGKTLVLGLGNDILRDDAIGIRVVRTLCATTENFPGLSYKWTTEMGLALLDYIVGFENLIIIDAIKTGKNPVGYIHILKETECPGCSATAPHFLGVGETVELGRWLGFIMPSRILILGIEVEDPFTVSEQMSPLLEANFDKIVEAISTKIKEFIRSSAQMAQGV